MPASASRSLYSDGLVLRAATAVMDQRVVLPGLARVQRQLQRIPHEVGVDGRAHAPARDATDVHVDDKHLVQPALLGQHIAKVRHPRLLGQLRLKRVGRTIQRTRRLGIANGGPQDPAPQTQAPNQALHRAMRYSVTFPVQLLLDSPGLAPLKKLGRFIG